MATKKSLANLFLLYFGSISSDDPLTIQHKLDGVGTNKDNHIHLVLHSLGGDPYAAAKVVNVLRSHCQKLTVVIPYWAMSAATLVTLGADQIIMFDTAQIGSLDMQLDHPVTEKRISALDYSESVASVVGQVRESAERFFDKINDQSSRKINSESAMNIAYESAVKLFLPLMSKLDRNLQ